MKKKNFILFLVAAFFIMGCSEQNFQTIATKDTVEAKAIYNADVDILWVIDNSYATMEQHQNRIASYMQRFYQGLIANKANFRISATTMDMSGGGEQGDLTGAVPVITQNTPDPITGLQNLLKRGGGGNNSEIGLGAMKRSLEKQVALGASANFLREEALLVVVFLTDDQDFSLGSVSDYQNFLDNLKGVNTEKEQNWIVNYVGVTELNNPNCTTYGNYSAIGQRYIDLANASGGVIDSICYTDFSSYMDQITVRLKSVLNEYKLEKRPILDSLSVYKNGVLIRQDSEDGWLYDEEKNSVFLNGESKPGPNDDIKFKYELAN